MSWLDHSFLVITLQKILNGLNNWLQIEHLKIATAKFLRQKIILGLDKTNCLIFNSFLSCLVGALCTPTVLFLFSIVEKWKKNLQTVRQFLYGNNTQDKTWIVTISQKQGVSKKRNLFDLEYLKDGSVKIDCPFSMLFNIARLSVVKILCFKV